MTPQAWFIGDDLGTNGGYALAYGTNSCPEDLPRTWEYWGFHTDQCVLTHKQGDREIASRLNDRASHKQQAPYLARLQPIGLAVHRPGVQ